MLYIPCTFTTLYIRWYEALRGSSKILLDANPFAGEIAEAADQEKGKGKGKVKVKANGKAKAKAKGKGKGKGKCGASDRDEEKDRNEDDDGLIADRREEKVMYSRSTKEVSRCLAGSAISQSVSQPVSQSVRPRCRVIEL